MPLELDHLDDHPFIVIVGSRRAGKSHLAKFMYQEMERHFDTTYVLTKTGASGTWDAIGEGHMFRDNFPEALQLIIECQEDVREKSGRAKMPRVCVILDDILGHIPHGDKALIDLATQGRWVNVTVILLTQYYVAFSPDVRNNTDLLVLFSNISKDTGDMVFGETSYSADVSKEEFRELYRQIAQGYTALAILRTSKAMGTKDRFFHITAPEKLKIDGRRKKRKEPEPKPDSASEINRPQAPSPSTSRVSIASSALPKPLPAPVVREMLVTPARSAAAASSSTAAPQPVSQPRPRTPTPNLATLERNATASMAEEIAASRGKKSKVPKALAGKTGYRYPQNRACDVIVDLSNEDNQERLNLMSRLERYAEAFPQANIAPADAFDLDLPDLRAFIRNTEGRLAGSGGGQGNYISLGVTILGATIEKFVPRLRGLADLWGSLMRQNETTIKLLEAKYGSPQLTPEVSLAIAFALPTFGLWQFNGQTEDVVLGVDTPKQ